MGWMTPAQSVPSGWSPADCFDLLSSLAVYRASRWRQASCLSFIHESSFAAQSLTKEKDKEERERTKIVADVIGSVERVALRAVNERGSGVAAGLRACRSGRNRIGRQGGRLSPRAIHRWS